MSSLFSIGDVHQMMKFWQNRESNNNVNVMLLHEGCALVHKWLFEMRKRKGVGGTASIFQRQQGTKFFNCLHEKKEVGSSKCFWSSDNNTRSFSMSYFIYYIVLPT